MADQPTQLTLSLFDTTSLAGRGLTLDAGFGAPLAASSFPDFEPEDSDRDDAKAFAIKPKDFRLTGDRQLGRGWKARAADNLAAMRLALEIEEQKRNASAEEQEILAKFTGFGASEIARALFRRAEEMFPAGWEELGDKLEQIATREDLASLARSTQYAHYTPELLICAIWRAIERMGFAGGAILEPGCG